MSEENWTEVPGGHGRAVALRAGQALTLRNTHGSQVVDTWALSAADPSEYLSVEQTRRMNAGLFVRQGQPFWSNRRNPMLTLEEDSFPGRHDMLIACCDPWLYRHFDCPDGHRNCHDNFLEALRALDLEAPPVPNPVNLWTNVPVDGEAIDVTTPLRARPETACALHRCRSRAC
ncbi:MAG: urea carboxylase-associated family protein [Kiloniellales bacterium]